MSRPSPRRRLDVYETGDRCERKKRCDGRLAFAREFGPTAWLIKWRVFRCDKCGKKHLTKTRRNEAAMEGVR